MFNFKAFSEKFLMPKSKVLRYPLCQKNLMIGRIIKCLLIFEARAFAYKDQKSELE